jgi:IS30 family transposase
MQIKKKKPIEAAEQQPSTSTRRLSDTLGPSKSTIHRHITGLRKIYKSCRVVHPELTAEQAKRALRNKGPPLRLVELRRSYFL